jgi:hypothetical protein
VEQKSYSLLFASVKKLGGGEKRLENQKRDNDNTSKHTEKNKRNENKQRMNHERIGYSTQIQLIIHHSFSHFLNQKNICQRKKNISYLYYK